MNATRAFSKFVGCRWNCSDEAMPLVIKSFVNAVVLTIILLVILFLGVLALVAYGPHSVESFCKGIGESDTPQAIIDRAKAEKLFYTRWQDTDDIWILNRPLEAAPLFRFACVVTFKGGTVSGKSVIDAD
jgi:hypothetical protein